MAGARHAPGAAPGHARAHSQAAWGYRADNMTAESINSGAGNAPGTPPVKRRPGKPKGYPKSGGRVKGTPNKSTLQTRDRIQQLADPIAFLADVMAGKRMVAAGEPGDKKKTWCYPTLAQRVQASETLLRKLLPDLKATELTGKDGAPLIEPTRRDELYSTMELARRTAYLLAAGDAANQELAALDVPRIDAEPQLVPEPEPKTATEKPEPAAPKEARSRRAAS